MLYQMDSIQVSASIYRLTLKEALWRALDDIDSIVSYQSWKRNSKAGSTAVVALKANNHLLIANIGDSKAFICSSFARSSGAAEEFTSIHERDLSMQDLTKELTIDHRPDRLDERGRVEAAGGFVTDWGEMARVNGQLAISRAIGDIYFKKYGIIAEPEFTDWQEIAAQHFVLILASDGVFERLNTEDVCRIVLGEQKRVNIPFFLQNKCLPESNQQWNIFAQSIVDAAYKSGSTDNLATVVYPLNLVHDDKNWTTAGMICDEAYISVTQATFTKEMDIQRGMCLPSQDGERCYELTERLPSGVVLPLTVAFTSEDRRIPSMFEVSKSHTGSDTQVDMYHEHLICLPQVFLSNEEEICLSPESFSTYLRLIERVPRVAQDILDDLGLKMNVGTKSSLSLTSIHQRYVITKNVGRGGFGEVWFAFLHQCPEGSTDFKHFCTYSVSEMFKMTSSRHPSFMSGQVASGTSSDHLQEVFVLKRILVEKGERVYLSGVRERHFGELFLKARRHESYQQSVQDNLETHELNNMFTELDPGLRHIARYLESFQASVDGDLWLVFRNEGYPLSSLLYSIGTTADDGAEESDAGHIRVLQPSNWWRWLRTTKEGQWEMHNLIYQLLLGLKACHSRNITHRDIKPENMMVRAKNRCTVNVNDGKLPMELPCKLSMRIIDFGSAVDAYSLQHLYGYSGPSRAEQTIEYTPPESLLQQNWLKSHANLSTRYDMWSVGIIMLELVLGTPHVFQISSRTRAQLDKQLEGWGKSALDTAYRLRALMELCILSPGHNAHHQHHVVMDGANLASWECTEASIMQKLKEQDPLGIGLEDVSALRLLRELLQWYPEDRITAEDAIQHEYFQPFFQGQ